MLKIVFPLLLLIIVKNNWVVTQLGLFILSFIVTVNCYHDFSFYEIGFILGIDNLGYIIICLSVWIIRLIVLSRQKVKTLNNFYSDFIKVNLVLLLVLCIVFASLDYLLFYIRFEASLIPTLILIIGWGYQPERIQAGIYILFYILGFSLPLLVSLLTLYSINGSLVITLREEIGAGIIIKEIWYFATIFAFLVKLPIYILHLWLPKAHVEAPVAGSIILAGVLLKLGGYGLIRFLVLFQGVGKEFCWIWVRFGLIGGRLVSLMCLRQVDIKSLIAYSSVAHIGITICGFIVFSWWGLRGGVIVIVGHGLCSSGLFCLRNIVYERLGRRRLIIRKGLLSFIPRIGLWWFLLRIRNIARPPSLNLLGEINLIISLIRWRNLRIWGLRLIGFFRASYSLYIYRLSQHGVFFNRLYSCCSGKVREYIVLFLHWFPLNIIILNRSLVII